MSNKNKNPNMKLNIEDLFDSKKRPIEALQ
jgi:hypothetical protein